MKKLYWVSLLSLLFFSCVSKENSVDLVVEYYNVGSAFFEAEQLAKAIEYYEKSLNIDPDFHKARYNLIYIQVEISDFKGANKNIKYLKELDALNLKINKLDAYIKYREGNLEDSLNLYLEVYAAGDLTDDVLLNIVKLYYQLESYDMAISFIDDLLLGEEDKSLYHIAGLVAVGAEDFDKAIGYYQGYIDLGGDNSDVLNELITIYEAQSDFESIKITLDILINSDDEKIKASSLFEYAIITLIHDNDFRLGYDYLVDSVESGFSDADKVNTLLEEPDLIEVDKIRQLFVDNEILK